MEDDGRGSRVRGISGEGLKSRVYFLLRFGFYSNSGVLPGKTTFNLRFAEVGCVFELLISFSQDSCGVASHNYLKENSLDVQKTHNI